jgi:hypothetical protein
MARKNKCFLLRPPPGGNSSAFRPDALAAGPRRCFPCGPALVGSAGWLNLGDAVPRGTSQQLNTHIRELKRVCYSWHPWHGFEVLLRSTFVKRGRAVACCLRTDSGQSQPLEVPLWMLDPVVCGRMPLTRSPSVSGQALRELQALLASARQHDFHGVLQAQHPGLLPAGGADVKVAASRPDHSTVAIPSYSSNSSVARAAARGATENSVSADATAASTRPQSIDGPQSGGGQS